MLLLSIFFSLVWDVLVHAVLPCSIICECINEKYTINRHFLFRCRLPLNRSPIFFKNLVSTNIIWLCQFRLSSIITPRNFNFIFLFRIIFLKFKSGNFWAYIISIRLFMKNINFILLVLIDRLFAKHKSVTFTRSLFTFSNNSFILLLYYLKRFFQQKNEVIWLHTIRLFQFSCHTRYQQTLNNFEHFLFHKSHQRVL